MEGYAVRDEPEPVRVLENVGGIVPVAACVIELTFLDGRKRLKVPVETLLKYDS